MKPTASALFRASLLALTPAALVAQNVVQLDQFNVTAQKRVQSIADVPVPITAVAGAGEAPSAGADGNRQR